MRAAEEVLKDLLDVAQLDIGVMRADFTTFPIAELLEDLRINLHRWHCRGIFDCRWSVARSGVQRRVLLRRILQNYLSNGLRYCKRGGIVIGCRRRGPTGNLRLRHRTALPRISESTYT